MQTRDYTPSTDPAAIAAFRQALRRARPRIVDRTAEFRRRWLRLRRFPGESLEIGQSPGDSPARDAHAP